MNLFLFRNGCRRANQLTIWSEMLTLTIQNIPNIDPVEFFNRMADGWEESCPEYGRPAVT